MAIDALVAGSNAAANRFDPAIAPQKAANAVGAGINAEQAAEETGLRGEQVIGQTNAGSESRAGHSDGKGFENGYEPTELAKRFAMPDVEARNADKAGKPDKRGRDGYEKLPECECETCKNRRYRDDSGDSTVSFQNATKISPELAATMVKKHEMEHVRHEQVKAKEEGRKIISQYVQIQTDTCPECGKIYVSGGLTTTKSTALNKDIDFALKKLFATGKIDEELLPRELVAG